MIRLPTLDPLIAMITILYKACTKQASQQIHSHIRVLNGTSKLPWPNNVPRYARV